MRVELKRLIQDKRATCVGNPAGISYFYNCSDRQICRRSLRCNSRVRRHSYGGSRWTDHFLLKSIVIGRHDGKSESENTHSAEEFNPSETPRHSEARDRPGGKSCQPHHIYTEAHAPTPPNNLTATGPF